MARSKFKSIDRNRYSKRYPLVRHPKSAALISADGDEVEIEVLKVKFNGQTKRTKFFDAPFSKSDFKLVLAPRDTSSSDSANVNLWIDNDNTDASKVTIRASAPFTGEVDVIAVRISAS